jgi:hypothetical protein
MTAIDWAIVILVLLLIPIGYRQGLVVGLLALVGFAVGVVAGSRLGPLLLADGPESPYAPLVALAAGLMLGGILAVLLEGIGLSIRARLRGGFERLDAAAGALLLGLLGFAVAWVVGAVALNTPALREYRPEIRRSAILAELNHRFPPSGPILNALSSLDPTPLLRGPSADVAAPKEGILAEVAVEEGSASVVRVSGAACGLTISGSGWVAAPEVVVTNAHVLAGQDQTTVETEDGSVLDAVAIAYRPRNDIAVLSVPGLLPLPLPLVSEPRRGTNGAILGYPGGGELSAAAARLGTTGVVASEDSYGRGPLDREMTSFRGEVLSGNSGGPVIDRKGRVLTTVFAAAIGTDSQQGLGVPNEITSRVLARADEQVDTGPCA